VVGIGGLDLHISKTATLSTIPWVGGPLFKDLHYHGMPILRVAVEPTDPRQMAILIDGLKLLHQSDPAVQIACQETGEHVIIAAGELHLERCLKDLRERFARIPINVSHPIVPFREGIALRMSSFASDSSATSTLSIERTMYDGSCSIRLSARPLPWSIAEFIEKHASMMRYIVSRRKQGKESFPNFSVDPLPMNDGANDKESASVDRDRRSSVDAEIRYLTKLKSLFEKEGSFWISSFRDIRSFGPRQIGPNILCFSADLEDETSLYEATPSTDLIASDQDTISSPIGSTTTEDSSCYSMRVRDYLPHLIAGFQLATQSGPLCEEPMMGIAFFLEKVIMKHPATTTPVEEPSQQRVSGQLIYLMKEACRAAFLEQSPRLILSMFSCIVQATTPEVLGKVYTVLSQRRGRIVAEHIQGEGSVQEDGPDEESHTNRSRGFLVEARFPVIESFGFADDLRRRTSGSAHPQLLFAGWEILDEDPFWVPKSREELEELGERADRANLALTYVNMVRRRKGLRIDEKLVEHAEKQRTRMKK
jgi:ribosome assembly protein 1